MATSTTNYGFSKPAASDTTVVRTTTGAALDAIDTALKSVADAAIPRTFEITAATPEAAASDWDLGNLGFSTTYYGNLRRFSGAGQNNYISWDVALVAGTWAFRVLGGTGADHGIISLRLDDVEVGTIDQYAVATTRHIGSVTGVVVATSGIKRLKIQMATKNASSSGYYCDLSYIVGGKTA